LRQRATALFQTYGNDHVALLGYSLKTKTPISRCVDLLGKGQSENWLVMSSDGEFKNEEHLFAGKRVASTIHKFKGLERKGILVCGMDSFIEGRAQRNPLDHFNLMYVACTRAKDKLVIQATTGGQSQKEYATIRGSLSEVKKRKDSHCKVVQLLQHVPFDPLFSLCESLFAPRLVYGSPHGFELDVHDRIITGRVPGTIEDLSPFIGQAVDAKLSLLFSGTLMPLKLAKDEFDADMCAWQAHLFQTKQPQEFSWNDLLRYAIIRETCDSGYKHYWRQMTPNLGGISAHLLDQCVDNAIAALYHTVRQWEQGTTAPSDELISRSTMLSFLQPKIRCQVGVSRIIPFTWFDEFSQLLLGSIDFVVTLAGPVPRQLLIELKISNVLRKDHLLQVHAYESMYEHKDVPSTSVHSMVLLANKGEMHLAQPKHVVSHEEFLYRLALRKAGQSYDPALLQPE